MEATYVNYYIRQQGGLCQDGLRIQKDDDGRKAIQASVRTTGGFGRPGCRRYFFLSYHRRRQHWLHLSQHPVCGRQNARAR